MEKLCWIALHRVRHGSARFDAILPSGVCRGPLRLDAIRPGRVRPGRIDLCRMGPNRLVVAGQNACQWTLARSGARFGRGLAMTRDLPFRCWREKESGPGALERRPARFLRKEEGFCPLQKTEPFSLPKQKASVNAVPSIPCSPRNHNIYFRPPTTATSVACSCPLHILQWFRGLFHRSATAFISGAQRPGALLPLPLAVPAVAHHARGERAARPWASGLPPALGKMGLAMLY